MVSCAAKCSCCQKFGCFVSYTKKEGWYGHIFICEECRDRGVDPDKAREESKLEIEKRMLGTGISKRDPGPQAKPKKNINPGEKISIEDIKRIARGE